jgi:hypothetical protein
MSIQESAPYRDPSLPVEQRVRDLLARMTLEEKAAQTANFRIGGMGGGGLLESIPSDKVRGSMVRMGDRPGDEVVQLYLNDVISSVLTPVTAL